MTYMNLVYGLACQEYFVAQWLEHPSGVVECHRFGIPDGIQIFLSCARDMITSFLISSLSLKFTIILYSIKVFCLCTYTER